MSDRARLADSIFTDALERPEQERADWIREVCGDDEELARRVLRLVELSGTSSESVDRRIDSARERLWRHAMADDPDSAEDLSGQTIGPWLLAQRLGRGGLSTVYLAQRNDGAFHQQAALKVLRRGLDTDDLVARFRSEREILSSLEHPGIARILDGGALPDGRPYLVLEFVDGLPITEHCEKFGLSDRERTRLLIDVAQAIGHAHRRMIIHRDIKPSNILVDAGHRIHVLDFGIAKLLDPVGLPGLSHLTRTGQSLLTPAYASPEQRSGETLTTASDVYQLGLVLQELLGGERPSSVAPKAGSSKRTPDRELGVIARKAMHEDPERRYATTEELVDDLQRYLQGLPVFAHPDSLGYRLRKLNGRKPWLLPVLGLSAALLIAYVVTLSVYSLRLEKARDLAQASQAFLLDVFKSPDPFEPLDGTRGSDITVVEALDIGARRARVELSDRPETLASLLGAISEVQSSLDNTRQAIELREEALAIERSLYGEKSSQAVASLRALGLLYNDLGDSDKATEMLQAQLELARDLYPPDSPEVGLAEIALAMNMSDLGEFNESRSLYGSGLQKLRQQPSAYPRELLSALVNSLAQWGLEGREEALPTLAEAARVAESAFGADSLQANLVKARLAATLTNFGEYEASEAHFQSVIPVLQSQLGAEHSLTLTTLSNLGYLYNRSGDHVAAERLYRDLLARNLAKRGEASRAVAEVVQNLASAIAKQGRYAEAIPLHRQAYETFRALYDDGNFVIAFPLLSLALAELQIGNGPAAEAYAREALERFENTLPGTHFVGVAQCLVGLSREAQGDPAGGSALLESAQEFMREGSIPDPYPALCKIPR